MTTKRMIKLGLLVEPPGASYNSWVNPTTRPDAALHFDSARHLVQLAESAGFAFAFVADSVSIEPGAKPYYVNRFEPFTLLGALSACTRTIGLVPTFTTSFTDPYTIARQLASLDHLSGGRAGFNLVTSAHASAAANYSSPALPTHDERYVRAAEYLEVLRGLWDTWDEDAFVRDVATRTYFDPERMHVLDHSGEYFQVRGPLNIERPVQGHPVAFQAGSSPVGRDFAARFAEGIFAKENSLDLAQEYYGDMKRRAAEHGRDPDQMNIFMGGQVVVGRTAAEAEDKYARILSYTDDEQALRWLGFYYNYLDFSVYDPDGPFPQEVTAIGANFFQGITARFAEEAARKNLTLREVAQMATTPREDFFGTPEQVADAMEQWFVEGAADGFLLNNWVQPVGLTDFVELVIPELRRRGIYSSEPPAATLRENLGLDHVPSRYQGVRS
ncbi:putative monooxygenase MoxC [Microbacterium sp. C448]|uniref:LLM class flavin-dependent oxidoreductase n=1 Tax=Microbacterium sp. C448 TaxID=1177594 RepID=UPI0003DE1544|nr:LLM class flavin-dependent oxidoreductase [Microbacterium sp. C448]CDK01792.1 putative monooxygenase MoxC [Microbacterium sp. C448]